MKARLNEDERASLLVFLSPIFFSVGVTKVFSASVVCVGAVDPAPILVFFVLLSFP